MNTPVVSLPQAPGTVTQVRAVLAFRLATVRGPARRRLFSVLALTAVLPVPALLVGLVAPRERAQLGDAQALMPSAWLAVLLVTALAAATSGGGRSLLPPEQRSAFPWSPAADHLGATLLAPLNVAWFVQVLGLLTLTSWVVGPRPGLVTAQLLTLGWVVFATCAGQTVGWLVELARTFRFGAWAVRATAVGGGAAFVYALLAGRVAGVLDSSPLVPLVSSVIRAGYGDTGAALRLGAGLLTGTAAIWAAGVPVVGLRQRRPARSQARVEARRYRAHPDSSTDLAAMLRIDRAGIWRSVPLRRGLFALVAIPGLAGLAAGLEWSVVPLLPGLVASGAGLLFGVNAWCLDASGSIWRSSLPGSPTHEFTARLVAIAEMCLVGGVLVVGAAALRAPAAPTTTELLAVGCAVLTTTAQVTARCMDWSTSRPYAAPMRDARDQPAPPAAMAGYAARLSLVTTVTALAFSLLSRADRPLLVGCLAVALTALALRRMLRAGRRWGDPVVRSRVIATVTG